MFDSDGATGPLRPCPFLGTWRALLYGELFVRAPDGTRGWKVFGRRMTSKNHLPGEGQPYRLRRTYCDRLLFLRSQAGLNMSCY